MEIKYEGMHSSERKETSKSIEADIRSVEFTLEKLTKYTYKLYLYRVHNSSIDFHTVYFKSFIYFQIYCYCMIEGKF